MSHNLIDFLSSVYILMQLLRCNAAPEKSFDVETVISFHFVSAKVSFLEGHPLYVLSDNARVALCYAAKEQLGLDGMLMLAATGVKEDVFAFGMYLLNGRGLTDVALICPTIPIVLIRLNDEGKIIIVVEKNPYENDEFDEEVVESITPISDVSEDSKKALRGHNLWWIEKENLKKMCIAAKKRIKRNITMLFSTTWIEIVGLYNIVPRGGGETKSVAAFPCSSFPKMYLRLVSDKKTAMFLEPSGENESTKVTQTSEKRP